MYCNNLIKRVFHVVLLFLVTLVFVSCVSEPEVLDSSNVVNDNEIVQPEGKKEEPTEAEPEVVPDVAPVVEEFDPGKVSSEEKELTMIDIKAFIEFLNSTIQKKDYETWLNYLTDEYKAYYSSAEVLNRLSQTRTMKKKKLVLTSLRDYFNYVVYPSRQNDRVDDIEYIEPLKIKAIIVTPGKERLVLYNLEKIGDTWKIAIWR